MASSSTTGASEPAPSGNRRTMLRDLSALVVAAGAAALVDGPALAQTATAAAKPAFPVDFPGHGAVPWFKRVFHLYTGPDGLTRAEQLPVNTPAKGAQIGQFLRRTAERVTAAGSAPHAGFDFHVANQPTLLIPIFGTMIIGLADGTHHELRHGDIAYAEDCSGKGHISRAGPQGSFMISVQLPKPLCPVSGSSDRAGLWND
jgi:hypothetical protein